MLWSAAEQADTEKIYVTADAQGKGYSQVSEILTLFYDETDAEYFQGKKNDDHGKICCHIDRDLLMLA